MKLPIEIPTFEELIKQNYVYVDKADLLYQLNIFSSRGQEDLENL